MFLVDSGAVLISLVVDRVLWQIIAFALFRSSLFIVSVGSHIDCLFYWGSYSQLVKVKVVTFRLICACYIFTVIIQLKKVGTVPAGDIECDCGWSEAVIEFRELHEKEPIIILFILDFFSKPVDIFRREALPAIVINIIILAFVVRPSPRISQSDESSSVLKYMRTDQTVDMTMSETIFLMFRHIIIMICVVRIGYRLCLHDGVLAILAEEFSEERGRVRTFIVVVFLIGCSSEGSEARIGIATTQVAVVPMELCQSLLCQKPPKAFIIDISSD